VFTLVDPETLDDRTDPVTEQQCEFRPGCNEHVHPA